jgi:hypothetical protein
MLLQAEHDWKILSDGKFITDKLLPPKGSNMEIDFSKEEYRTFLDILEIANWVLFALRTDEPEELKIYADFEQKIYSYARAFGFTNLIMYDEEFGKYFPTNEHDMNSPARPFIDEFENETFWDELTERMAQRDMKRELGEKLIKMTREEKFKLYHDFEKKYSKEFKKHGIERLKIGD